MKSLLLPAILIAGCSSTPIEDLYVQHAKCVNAGAVGCDAMWDEITRYEEARAKKEAERKAKQHCPSHLVDYDDNWGHRGCLSRNEVRRMLGQ